MIFIKKRNLIFYIIFIIFISTILIPKIDSSKIINPKLYAVNNKMFKSKLKSANLSTDYDINQTLDDVKTFELNTINIPVVIEIKSLKSSDMKINEYSLKKAIKLIKKLKARNINVILEAYPWINNGAAYETSWSPNNVNEFFYNWKNNILKVLIEKVAKPYRVYALNVASNLVCLEKYQDKWCDIINFVRNNYDGFITYRTCWWYTAKWDKTTFKNFDNKLHNKLFSKVDFISVAAYFELTNRMTNTVPELVHSINDVEKFKREQDIKKQLYELSKKWCKPIFFGELGFPRKEGCSIEPWNEFCSNIYNNNEQARCFEAYREVFEKKPWQLGFSIFAVGESGKDKNYYPSKPSMKVINNWYK